jgi:hypothetical protein
MHPCVSVLCVESAMCVLCDRVVTMHAFFELAQLV